MPILTEEQAQSNPILRLAAELRRRTCGMCDVGVGAWGFGINTLPLTKVGTIVCMDPDPYGEAPLPSEITEYTVTLKPTCNEQDSVRCGMAIHSEELQRLCGDQDIMTRLVARALLELSSAPIVVSKQEDDSAYESIRIAELQQEERITPEEAARLQELRWYETKTPEEIVDFQLRFGKLCMTMEQFREAAEAVFNRPITAGTLDDCRMELLEERREMIAAAATNTPGQKTGPVML